MSMRWCASGAKPAGLVTATRGNHGQSIAAAATRNGIPVVIVVPEGNSPEKNAAMAAFGGEIITGGKDFDESRGIAAAIQRERGYHFVPSFHRELVKGVATYAYELFSADAGADAALDAVYVPIGMGSGICGLITVRDLLGPQDRDHRRRRRERAGFRFVLCRRTSGADQFGGDICRRRGDTRSAAEALEIIKKGASRVVRVSEDEIADAIRLYYTTTHNLAEGAGAAPLAALMKEKSRYAGKRVGLILTGGNIDMPVMEKVLRGQTPSV